MASLKPRVSLAPRGSINPHTPFSYPNQPRPSILPRPLIQPTVQPIPPNHPSQANPQNHPNHPSQQRPSLQQHHPHFSHLVQPSHDSNSSEDSGSVTHSRGMRRPTLEGRGLNDESALIHITGLKSAQRNQREMSIAAEKLKQVMNDIDTVIVDPGEEDRLLADFFKALEGLEGGKLKYHIREFVDRYRNISSIYKNVTQEKSQAVECLSEWFLMELGGKCGIVWKEEVQKELTELRIAFDHLQKLTVTLHEYRSHGFSFDHLESEKTQLERKAVGAFTKFADYRVMGLKTAKIKNPDPTIDSKMANIMKKWNSQAKYFEADMTKLKNDNFTSEAFKAMQKSFQETKGKVEDIIGLIRILYEENETCQKEMDLWKEENIKKLDEKGLLQKKLIKLKVDYREALYQLEQYQVVNIPAYLAVENDAVTEDEHYEKEKREDILNPDRTVRHEVHKHTTVDKDSTLLQKILESTKHELEVMKKNHKEDTEAFRVEIRDLQNNINEQVDMIKDLKRQKASLLEQLQTRLSRDESIPKSDRRRSDATDYAPLTAALLTKGPAMLMVQKRRTTITDYIPEVPVVDSAIISKKHERQSKAKEQAQKRDAIAALNDTVTYLKKEVALLNSKKSETEDDFKSKISALEKQVVQKELENKQLRAKLLNTEAKMRTTDHERRMSVYKKQKEPLGQMEMTLSTIPVDLEGANRSNSPR